MVTLRKVLPALSLAASLTALGVYAATTAPTTPTPAAGAPGAPGPNWHHGHHHGFGPMGFVLHKLNLTADQKTRVKGIWEDEKSQFEALRASSKANREALAKTPPTDPGYPALIQTAQANAATRIKLESETWSAVYGNVLTKAQQDAIPGIVTAAQQAREARFEAWRAEHPQAPAPAAE
jgi:Spy/CpxP family protein refolding chaperone